MRRSSVQTPTRPTTLQVLVDETLARHRVDRSHLRIRDGWTFANARYAVHWLGDDFDPQAFSVDEVNRRLALLQRRRKKAAAGKQ